MFTEYINQTINDIKESGLNFTLDSPIACPDIYFSKVLDRAMQLSKQEFDREMRTEKPSAKEKDSIRKMIRGKTFFEKVNGKWVEHPIEMSAIKEVFEKYNYPADLDNRELWQKWLDKLTMDEYIFIKNTLKGE